MQSVADQVVAFSLVMCLGFFVGFIFDCYRILRQVFRLNHVATILGDLIFWIIITCFSYAFLLWSNWGEVRVYVFLAIGVGFICYLQLLSHKIRLILFKVYQKISRIIQAFTSIIKKIHKKIRR